ncbi:hypothetical protein ACH5RR_011359 [Cinchona calisaya]|uniref:Chromo domain-containing protein n=1 Tax=Cinchona calisaya TaxID=153742 RepID=A0ABD3A663_9GENT
MKKIALQLIGLLSLIEEARDNLNLAQHQMKKYADMGRREVDFQTKKNRRTNYLIHWKGEAKADATWERDVTLWQFEDQAGCLDVESPLMAGNAVKLQQWAQADKEFLRMLCTNKDLDSTSINSPNYVEKGIINNINVGRQRYLRSYMFRKKESSVGRAKKWLLTVKMHHSKNRHQQQQGGPACSISDYYISRFLFVCLARVGVN